MAVSDMRRLEKLGRAGLGVSRDCDWTLENTMDWSTFHQLKVPLKR